MKLARSQSCTKLWVTNWMRWLQYLYHRLRHLGSQFFHTHFHTYKKLNIVTKFHTRNAEDATITYSTPPNTHTQASDTCTHEFKFEFSRNMMCWLVCMCWSFSYSESACATEIDAIAIVGVHVWKTRIGKSEKSARAP